MLNSRSNLVEKFKSFKTLSEKYQWIVTRFRWNWSSCKGVHETGLRNPNGQDFDLVLWIWKTRFFEKEWQWGVVLKSCVYMRVSVEDEKIKRTSVSYICVQERGGATIEKTYVPLILDTDNLSWRNYWIDCFAPYTHTVYKWRKFILNLEISEWKNTVYICTHRGATFDHKVKSCAR